MATIRELNEQNVQIANHNSMSGTRGDASKSDYLSYAEQINSWDISEEKKQKLLDKLHEKWSKLLAQEAQHVSWVVAGLAKYNAKRLDHSDRIFELSKEVCDWFDDIKEQATKKPEADKAKQLVEMIEFCSRKDNPCNPTSHLCQLATVDNAKFIELFEKLMPEYKWRKNSVVYKLYAGSLAGMVKEIKPETFFEDENFTAFTEGDRVYIRFTMRPQRQLIVALKSRGWWWNSGKSAWSTYPSKLDKEWVASISERYAKYI